MKNFNELPNELLIFQMIENKYLIKFYGFYIDKIKNQLLIFNELIEGGDLSNYFNLEFLNDYDKLNISISICKGFNYLNKNKIKNKKNR
jgi:serine/threonine protein kinase